jgi:hypothetical protein
MALSEEIRNAIIELVEQIDEEMGFIPNPEFDPDLEYILTAVRQYRKGVNYRRLKNKKDNALLKQFSKLDPETRAELMRKLGL